LEHWRFSNRLRWIDYALRQGEFQDGRRTEPLPSAKIALSMQQPINISHPFFAYGIFRPGQLGFFQLKDLVSEILDPNEIAGSLLLRDGLPIIGTLIA
jgi:hypothetical protein